ncbi:O-antigen ligase family protein [Paenibacillus piri]|uniref:O-antigen ligase domain-containing protein n=1 Tax=Paenibacillus piri TaxID=2547395 RepID=A0A4R5KLW6_9BACL|nr:O-antigen ligase family protein [Paenibacillus piri]TDF96202.1 O-antigen ligase domain-containing protein [Paenibacillus piri]
MSYKNPNASTIKSNQDGQKSSLLFWILSAFTALFLFWAPFQKGLFNGNTYEFERPIYSSFVWAFIILFIMSIFLFYNWKLNKQSDLLSLVIWLIPITFVISSIFAASSYYAVNMIYIQFAYSVFFLLGIYISNNNLGASIVRNSIIYSAYFIVIFGLFNWFGNKEAIFKLVKWFSADMIQPFYQDAVMTDANGVRLTSVFQYANSYAAFLIAVLLCSLYMIVISRKWSSLLIHGIMVVPIIISFFLTLSRGGLVILPVVLLAVLPFLKPYKQLVYIIQMAVSFIISFIILNKITNVGIELSKNFVSGLSLQGWGVLLLASIINAALALCIMKYIAPYIQTKLLPLTKYRLSNVILPIGAVVIGTLMALLLFNDTGLTKLLPENIKTRIENINFQQHSVLERGTFYSDAIKLFKDYPVSGAGGGAWSALYEKYQNNPYVSRQAHNFFLQYLVEVGIIGLIVLLFMIGWIFYLFIRNQLKNDSESNNPRFIFYIVTISLLIHSMIDFDLSYVYLGILLFLCLGAMISNIDVGQLSGKWTAINKYKWIYPSVLIIFALVMFFNSTQLLNANSNFRAADSLGQNNKSINEIFVPLNNALSQHPYHPQYADFKIDILLQAYSQTKDERYYNDATALIQQTLQREPRNRFIIEKKISAMSVKGQLPEVLALINKEMVNFPWDISFYERSITIGFELGEKARQEKNNALKDQYWNQSIEVYKQVQAKTKELEALPKEQLQGRAFGLTKNMALALGNIDLIRGNYAAAENFFKFQLTDQFDDPLNKQMARSYLATLQKQNKNDQALLNKLIAKDPKEKDEIIKLVNATF